MEIKFTSKLFRPGANSLKLDWRQKKKNFLCCAKKKLLFFPATIFNKFVTHNETIFRPDKYINNNKNIVHLHYVENVF